MFGLGPWWFNFSQFHRSELTVDNLTSVPSPYIELTIFGTFKAAEFLSFVGMFNVFFFFLKPINLRILSLFLDIDAQR